MPAPLMLAPIGVQQGVDEEGELATAREAVRRGVDGIVVSNHGGRQVDGAVGDKLTILFDSGIRSGSDALKALALGADAVCLGRPCVWGLALGGQAGWKTA